MLDFKTSERKQNLPSVLEYQLLELTCPFTITGERFTRGGLVTDPKRNLEFNILLIRNPKELIPMSSTIGYCCACTTHPKMPYFEDLIFAKAMRSIALTLAFGDR